MAKRWIQSAVKRMKKKGTVGSFSRAAKRAGMSTSAYANKVLKKGSKASPAMKKKANFAKNVGKSKRKK
jgi:hypothetical protein